MKEPQGYAPTWLTAKTGRCEEGTGATGSNNACGLCFEHLGQKRKPHPGLKSQGWPRRLGSPLLSSSLFCSMLVTKEQLEGGVGDCRYVSIHRCVQRGLSIGMFAKILIKTLAWDERILELSTRLSYLSVWSAFGRMYM